MKGFGNIGNLLGQLQKIQEQAKEMQKELEKKVVEASAGGDMVIVKMNGKKELIDIKISKEVVNPEDIEMLEDLIIAAVNKAYTEVQNMTTAELSKLTGGLNIPGLSNFI